MELKSTIDVAKEWLNEVSSDDGWIDANSEFTLQKLAALIMEERDEAIRYALEQRAL